MLLHDFLEQTARAPESAPALSAGGIRLSWRALRERAAAVAASLQSRGLRPGQRVVLILPNGVEFVVAVYAALLAGAVFVPLSPQTKAAKIAYILEDAEPTVLVADEHLRREWGEAAAGCRSLRTLVVVGGGGLGELRWSDATNPATGLVAAPVIDQDLASIIYTSGSTGDPKGVMLTHLNMVSAANSVGTYLGYTSDDVIFCALPLSFDYGLYQVLLAARVGASVVLEPSFAYPVQALEVMEREKCTVFPAVPTMMALVLGLDDATFARFDLSGLRLISNTAAALSVRQIREIRARFPKARLFSMYGLTECKRVTYLPPEELDRRPTSVGRGMPNQEVFLVDEEGRRLPLGSTGELVIRGSHVMRGYWRKPVETAERLRRGEYPGDVLLFSGDLFRMDDDGWLYFLSRKDDIIKSRGEKVSPREVENVIGDIPEVVDVAVVGEPDPLLGEAVKAFVVLRAGDRLDEHTVIRHCRDHLESHMVPRHVVFVDSLPKTGSGKVSRRALRETAAGSTA